MAESDKRSLQTLSTNPWAMDTLTFPSLARPNGSFPFTLGCCAKVGMAQIRNNWQDLWVKICFEPKMSLTLQLPATQILPPSSLSITNPPEALGGDY